MTDGAWGDKPSWWPEGEPWPPTGGTGTDEGQGGTTFTFPPETKDTNDMSRGELRSFLTQFGLDLPVTMEDLYETANFLKSLQAQASVWEANPPMVLAPGKTITDIYGPLIQRAASKLMTYGVEYLGTQGAQAQSAYTIFSELIRPPQPMVEKKPTAEEFLSDFDQGFRQTVEGMRAAGTISGAEAEFAYNNLRPQFYNKYLAELGKFAEAGASPFALREVTRGERGVAPGTTAGKALEGAVGAGVQEPTRVREEISTTAAPGATGGATAAAQAERRITELREQVENVGQGVPKEFIALPRLMPADFLGQQLSPESIRLAYAGSAEGGGARKQAGQAPSGFTSSVRRV